MSRLEDTILKCSICGAQARIGDFPFKSDGHSHTMSKKMAQVYLTNHFYKYNNNKRLYEDSEGNLFSKVRISDSFPDNDHQDFVYCDQCRENGKLDDFIKSFALVEPARSGGGCASVIICIIFIVLSVLSIFF